MNEISKFKTELSKIAGVDFHNPKFREIFKRYLGARNEAVDEEEENKAIIVEDAKAADAVTDEAVIEKAEEVKEEIVEDQAEDAAGVDPDYKETAEKQDELVEAVEENKEADAEIDEAKDEAKEEADEEAEEATEELSNEEKALRELIGEPKAEVVVPDATEEVAEVKSEVESQPAVDVGGQLREKILELELVKAGIREDRIPVAMRLFLPELEGGATVEEVRAKIAEFPEWVVKKGGAQGFGMPIGDKAGAYTNEEKALKAMGIDPRG